MKDKRYIFGIYPVTESLRLSENIDKIFLQRDIKPELRREILQLANSLSVPVQFVPSEKLKRLVPSGNHQGVVAAIAPIAFSEIEHLVPWWYENGLTPLVVVLDEVTDVRNMGAIARTAECAGANAIMIPHKNSAQVNAQTVKTSAGALFNIPLCRSKNLKQSLQFLRNSGFTIFACTEKAEKLHWKAQYTGPVALVFGNEEYGISQDILKIADYLVKIPMMGSVSSLNVSVAAGVLLFEVVRQRT